MQLVQTVAPTQEPISLSEAKEFLRILDNVDDLLIASLIVSTREHVENLTNRQLETATFELYAGDFISKLPKNPIQSIEKIEYMDESGAYVLLDATTYYMYERNGIGYINYSSIPMHKEHMKSVKITFVSGYTTVPEAIKSYMKVKIATLYEFREEFIAGVSVSEIGNGYIENLLSSYRVRS